jgi:CubicO group peptidase (beta-lactamase class C family)
VALTNYLKTKEGPDANVWAYIAREVYGPLGIHYAPTNKTIEANSKDDQPLMAYGYYPTIGDLIKIARLYQNGGKLGDKQLLNAEMLADIKPSADPVGLPTGVEQKPYYRKAFWRAHYQSDDCSFYYPIMDGWGENYVLLMPKGVTAFRLAKNWDGDPGAGDLRSMAAVGNKLKAFCK